MDYDAIMAFLNSLGAMNPLTPTSTAADEAPPSSWPVNTARPDAAMVAAQYAPKPMPADNPAGATVLPQFTATGPLTNPPMPPVRPQAAPANAAPVASPKKRIDPASVDLATNPRFTTVQYGVPSGRGPLSSNPIFTALNLGGSS